jgi:hypothetical protein
MALPATRYGISPMAVLAVACFVLTGVGMELHLERFITPEKGLGYALGIIGGSAMILLLLYPARKRLPWLGMLGGVKAWFQVHMALGLLGPLLVLYHANFSTGATNSNVALFCMLVVSGSGLVGRYFYARVHVEFYDSQASLADLRGRLARMQQVSGAIAFVPDLFERLNAAEAHMMRNAGGIPGLMRPLVIATRAFFARRRLSSHIRRAARAQTLLKGQPASAMTRERKAARELSFRHIDAVRRVAEFETYERLFSLWHHLHLPLFFMLLIAGIVHVISVHVY